MKKKKPQTFPKPKTVAMAFAKHGYQIETIANHYDLYPSTVEELLAKYIRKISGWDK